MTRTKTAGAKTTGTQPVSNDPNVPTPETDTPRTPPATKDTVAPASGEAQPDSATQAAQAASDATAAVVQATNSDGTVDPQAAAIAGQARRETADANKQTSTVAVGVVPTNGIVRQLEDGTETDRRTGAGADKSLAGENLPVLRQNEPDPRQGVTTGDLTNPGVRQGEDRETVTFLVGYHLYNKGEQASFSAAEAARLRDLGVAE